VLKTVDPFAVSSLHSNPLPSTTSSGVHSEPHLPPNNRNAVMILTIVATSVLALLFMFGRGMRRWRWRWF